VRKLPAYLLRGVIGIHVLLNNLTQPVEEIDAAMKVSVELWPTHELCVSAISLSEANTVVPDYVVSVGVTIPKISIECVTKYLSQRIKADAFCMACKVTQNLVRVRRNDGTRHFVPLH